MISKRNKWMKFLVLLLAVMILSPAFAQKKKKDDEETISPAFVEGVTYALPRTGFRVHVEAMREKFVPGPYAAFAEQLLGIQNAKTRAYSKWSVVGIKIETFSEPDPEQVHKAIGEVASMLSLSSNGCLAGINVSAPVEIPMSVQTNKTFQKPDIDDGFSFDYFSDTPFVIAGDSTNGFRPTRVSAEQKAAEAAKRILNSRMNQYELATLRIDGDYPDGKAYEVSLEEMQRTEQNYIKLFVGRTTYKTESYSFDYVPGSKEKNASVIFRISDENGVVPASDLSGKPVMIEFEPDDALQAQYQKKASSENPNAGSQGIFYRMPAVANVKITYGLNPLASARTTVAQFGVVAPLPEEFLNGIYSISFHPETGAIKSVSTK